MNYRIGHEHVITLTSLVSVAGGLMNDWIGRKPVITMASLVFMAGSLLLALAENRSMLLVGRFVVGAGIGRL